MDRPHVIWVGVKEGAQQLVSLAVAVQEALVPLGFERDARPFQAHATLGRVKHLAHGNGLREKLSRYGQANFGQCMVKVLTWYKSTLTLKGPIYEVLETIPLASK